MTAHYDDPAFSYTDYWQGRDYEHESELVALRKLIGNKKYASIADIGGGFGRLIPFLADYSKKTYLIEPSLKQRNIAKKLLKNISGVEIKSGTAEKTSLADNSVALVTVVRVMHHLPEFMPALTELHRILKPEGSLILEFANSKHFKAQITSFLTGKPILPTPIERRSIGNIKRKTIPFVNHHPFMVMKNLKRTGFAVDEILSVSNLRSPTLKRSLSVKTLVGLEGKLQGILAKIYFGPSIFVLAHKI